MVNDAVISRVFYVVIAVALANFFTFFGVSMYLGGDAVNGYVENGHYFVSNHGKSVEVRHAVYVYSYAHAVSVWITHLSVPVVIVWMLVAGRIAPHAVCNRAAGGYAGTMPITGCYSPDDFTLVPMSALSKQHFDAHPIWSEHYDCGERDEIINWGVDPQWLAAELERVHDGNDHFAYPILRPYPLPHRMRLYIRARITLDDGCTVDGYVMNQDAYFLTIFANHDEFGFSRNGMLADHNRKEVTRLAAALGRSPVGIFPVKYETDFLDSQDRLIRGVFSLPASDG